MGKVVACIDESLKSFIEAQHIFFIATAPLSADGHINCSPKGGDCFRVLGPLEVAYADYTGSGAETIAHLKENGRVVVTFCAFDGKPNIVRLHGQGRPITPENPRYEELLDLFPANPGTRSIIHIVVDRVSTSCGFSIPIFDYREERSALDKWAETKGPEGLAEYRSEKNVKSIDGLPALP